MSAGSSLGGMVKLENGSRKLADAEAKVAETQARLTGMYNKDVINAVHDELLTEQLGYRSPSEVRYPPPASVSVNEDAKNLVLLTAPTQNGKTNEMLALIWTGFFKYKLPSYVFLRSDATAYSDISDSVRNFNQKIVDFLLAKMDSQKLIGFDPEHYTLELSTLQASKKVNTDQVVTIPVNGRGRRFLKPIVRCRLLTAGNVERALGPDEIQAIAAEFGTTADGERLNLMVFVDEAQNTRQTLTGGTFKLEKNLFRSYYSHHRYGLLGAVHRWCTRHGLTGIVEPESLKKSLRRLAALYVEVSATPEATLLVESDSTAQHVQVKMWDNYYGFISSLPDQRRIQIKPITQSNVLPNTDLAHVQQWEDSEKQFVKISCSEIGRNSKNYEHIIVYTGFSKNADMDEVARYLTDGDEKSMRSSERPVVVLCAYANGSNGMGSSIFFNDFAAKLLGPHILEAEKKLFLSKQDYLELLEKYPGRYGTEIPKNGEFVPYPDPESDRIWIMMKDSMQGMQPGRHYRMEQDYKEIQMPRKMLYRLRAQLTIVREACELARVDPSTLFIVTLGQRLLREGLTVKTWRHDLPPTIMICSIPSHKLIKRPAVELIQALGRLCGLRQAPYDKAPTLLLHESAVPVFKAMVDCNHALCQRVASRIRSNPNISLGAAAAGEFPTLFERILSRRLQHVPNEELYGSEELCQHNAEFFDPITRHRMLSLLERHFNEKELALIFNMLETLREPDLSPDRSDFSPSEYFTFNEMWGYLMNCDLVEDETRLEERFYNGVVKKLIALAERPETSGASGLIAVAERAGIEHGQGAVPIYLARDSFADGSEWGILTSWNISKWLKTRCSCETRDQESRHFVRCSKCSFWYHQACFADLNQFVVESGGEIEGLMYLCGNCRQNFVDLTDED